MATGRPPGRPPKPIEVKEAEGNRGNKRLPKTQLGLNDTPIPKLPAGYTAKDKEAKWVWEFIWKQTDVLKTPDYFIAVLFTETWVDYLKFSKGFRENTLVRVATNPNGTIQNHPNWSQFKDIKAQLNTYMSSLGFSPADRARIFLAAEAEEEKEELKKLMGNRKVTEV